MKNLPIKKRIEKLLNQDVYKGVWKVKNKEMYVKLTSKLNWPIIQICPSDYGDFKDALEDTIACAKVYKKFIEEGLYHPDTQVVVCKDDENNLALMVTMPELKTYGNEIVNKKFIEKFEDILEKVVLDYHDYLNGDLTLACNWGCDKKTNEFYAHDLHVCCNTKQILDMAKELGYKK